MVYLVVLIKLVSFAIFVGFLGQSLVTHEIMSNMQKFISIEFQHIFWSFVMKFNQLLVMLLAILTALFYPGLTPGDSIDACTVRQQCN